MTGGARVEFNPVPFLMELQPDNTSVLRLTNDSIEHLQGMSRDMSWIDEVTDAAFDCFRDRGSWRVGDLINVYVPPTVSVIDWMVDQPMTNSLSRPRNYITFSVESQQHPEEVHIVARASDCLPASHERSTDVHHLAHSPSQAGFQRTSLPKKVLLGLMNRSELTKERLNPRYTVEGQPDCLPDRILNNPDFLCNQHNLQIGDWSTVWVVLHKDMSQFYRDDELQRFGYTMREQNDCDLYVRQYQLVDDHYSNRTTNGNKAIIAIAANITGNCTAAEIAARVYEKHRLRRGNGDWPVPYMESTEVIDWDVYQDMRYIANKALMKECLEIISGYYERLSGSSTSSPINVINQVHML